MKQDNRFISWLYKWLPILFGCHCRAERSFFYKGRRFPICARCTGELAGIVLGLILYWIVSMPVWVLAALMLPLILDGVIQMLTSYESNNIRRFVTGVLFGYSLLYLFLMSVGAAFQFGMGIGLRIKY